MTYKELVWVEETDPILGTGWCGWVYANTGEIVDPQPAEPEAEYPF